MTLSKGEGLPVRPVKHIAADEIYDWRYRDAVRGDLLPDYYVVSDGGVNSGVGSLYGADLLTASLCTSIEVIPTV